MQNLIVNKEGDDKPQPSRTEIQLACFRVGDGLFALDILRIKEIIRPQKLTPVPNAPAFIEGVLNLRGTIVPVIDLLRRFAGNSLSQTRKSRIVICLLRGKLIGLAVDEVLEVRSYQRHEVLHAPDFMDETTAVLFSGVCRRDQDLILILNLENIFTGKERQHLEQIHVLPTTSLV